MSCFGSNSVTLVPLYKCSFFLPYFCRACVYQLGVGVQPMGSRTWRPVHETDSLRWHAGGGWRDGRGTHGTDPEWSSKCHAHRPGRTCQFFSSLSDCCYLLLDYYYHLRILCRVQQNGNNSIFCTTQVTAELRKLIHIVFGWKEIDYGTLLASLLTGDQWLSKIQSTFRDHNLPVPKILT